MSNGTTIVCGIDAGGSKTDALICSLDGAVLGRALAGPGALRHTGVDYAEAVRDAVDAACSDAGVEPGEVEMASVGLAGLDSESSAQDAVRALKLMLPARRLMIVNDAEIALHAAVAVRPAGVLIAGTGSIAYGEDEVGCTRLGGYGPLLGDEGSGFWLAKRALKAVLLAAQRCGPETALTAEVRAHFAIRDEGGVIGLAAAGWQNPNRIAVFAPVVFALAARGDGVARTIVDEGARALAELGSALVSRLSRGAAPLPLALAGSVLTKQPEFADAIGEFVVERHPAVRTLVPSLPPAAGAALHAIRALTLIDGDAVRARMQSSLASVGDAEASKREASERTIREPG